nr:hypothetical protein HK105_005874 [Polyrhizophydium stewartii]
MVPGQSEERLTRHGQSYSFMTWSTRSQEWAAALFLTFVFPGTLLPVSIFSLAATATTILVSPLTVGLIDSFPRLPVTLSALSAQKLAIALAAGLLWARHGSFGSLPAAGDAADRTFRADAGYVVVLRRIDLVCKLAAPLFVSVVAAAGTVPIAMAAVAGQSLTTMVLEWILLVFPTIVAIAQVYLTALAYGGPMVSYLLNRGYSQTLLAILRAFVLSVAEIDVGLLSGVQLSLQNVFDLLGYVTTIIWHNPDDFWIPAVISFGAVLSAAITFSAYARKVRGHLVHMDRVARLFTKKTQ